MQSSLLIQKGASLVANDCFRNLPIDYAAAGGYLDMVKLLIKNNSPCSTKGVLGLTPYQTA